MVGLLAHADPSVSRSTEENGRDLKTYLRRRHELLGFVPLSSFCDRVVVVHATISITRLLPQARRSGVAVNTIHVELPI
jgi:hypothetical protein